MRASCRMGWLWALVWSMLAFAAPTRHAALCSDGGTMSFLTLSLPPTSPGEFIAVGLYDDDPSVFALSVTDNAGNSYVDQGGGGGGTPQWVSDLWVSSGSDGGVVTITASFSSAVHVGALLTVFPSGTLLDKSWNAASAPGCGGVAATGVDAGDVMFLTTVYSVPASVAVTSPAMPLDVCPQGESLLTGPVSAGTFSLTFTPSPSSTVCGYSILALIQGSGTDAGAVDAGISPDAGVASDAGGTADAGSASVFLQVGCGCGASAAGPLLTVAILLQRIWHQRRKRVPPGAKSAVARDPAADFIAVLRPSRQHIEGAGLVRSSLMARAGWADPPRWRAIMSLATR